MFHEKIRKISAIFFNLVLFLVISGVQSWGSIAFAYHDTDTDLLVKFKVSLDETWINNYFSHPRKISFIPSLETYEISFFNREERNFWLGKAKTDSLVEYADYNHRYYLETTPNDTQYGSQWGLSKINTSGAWDYTTGSNTIVAAVLDTGIDGQHEDLSGRVLPGYDYINNRVISADAVSDDHGHGTLVAGIIAALTNNSKGIAGMNWNTYLMPIKVVNSAGVGDSTALANGITFAADNGVRVINLSLGGEGDDPTLSNAIRYATNKGVLVVAASGNENTSVSYPAVYPEVLAVGASDENDSKAAFSNFGPELDVVAPGVNILTTKWSATHNQYQSVSGTSIAAPFVSGLAALLWSKNPGLTPAEAKSTIENNADKVSAMGTESFTNQYGNGRINANRTLVGYNDFHNQFSNQNGYPTLSPGQSYNFQVSFTNTGNSAWFGGGPNPIRLGTSHGRDHITPFIREDRVNNNSSGWVAPDRIQMQQTRVGKGETGTFSFWLTVPENMSPGTYREYFQPVADGVAWLEDYGVYWDINVPEYYHSQFVNQNAYPTLSRGQAYNFTVQFRNTGSTTWNPSIVHLGTSHDRDRIPAFIREDIVNNNPSGWVAQNRVRMTNSSVAPGETATFNFWMSVPADKPPGVYREFFQLVANGNTWMEDYGVYWDVVVQ